MTHSHDKRAWLSRALSIAVIACAVGCGDEAPPPAKTAGEVLARWQESGLEVTGLQPLEEHDLGKATCRHGPVAGVETTLCLYETEGAAAVATSAGLAMVGNTTGAALVRGRMLLVVADRGKTDPDGKTINRLTKIFLGR